jgi:hypothetical protein
MFSGREHVNWRMLVGLFETPQSLTGQEWRFTYFSPNQYDYFGGYLMELAMSQIA